MLNADELIYKINHAYISNYNRPGSVTADELMALLQEVKTFLERTAEPTYYCPECGVMEGNWHIPACKSHGLVQRVDGVKGRCGYCGQDVEQNRECRSSDEAGRCAMYQEFAATRKVDSGVNPCEAPSKAVDELLRLVSVEYAGVLMAWGADRDLNADSRHKPEATALEVRIRALATQIASVGLPDGAKR